MLFRSDQLGPRGTEVARTRRWNNPTVATGVVRLGREGRQESPRPTPQVVWQKMSFAFHGVSKLVRLTNRHGRDRRETGERRE